MIKSGLIKAALLLACLCCFSPDALCNGSVTGDVHISESDSSSETVQYGTVTGKVDVTLPRYRKGIVVYLKGAPERVVPGKATIDQKNLKFIPHVVAVPIGSAVSFVNSDKVNHDIFSANACKKFDIDDFHPGSSLTMTFDKACEINLLCDLHPEMSGYLIVVDSNHIAVTGEDGNFTIGAVPSGTYEVAVWSEKLKPQRKMTITVNRGETSSIVIDMKK